MATVEEFKQIKSGITDFDVELIKQLGLPNKIISGNIGISDMAIGMRVRRIGIKLGVENKTAIVIKSLVLGIITLDQLVFREFNGKTNSS